MKQQKVFFKIVKSAAWILLPGLVLAQNVGLSLKHGIYVDESVSCKEPPFAVMKSWDGVGFSGPHSSRCTSRTVSRHGNEFRISTSCAAIGDGTPNPSGTADIETVTVTRQSSTRFTSSSETKAKVTYRWCGADDGLGNFPKRKP